MNCYRMLFAILVVLFASTGYGKEADSNRLADDMQQAPSGSATDEPAQSSGSDDKMFDEFINMSMEELVAINVMVTSAARRPQSIGQASSAMYVISAEDIHQSGITSLGDLLRLVPGLNVSHTFGFQYQIGIRGFASFNAKRYQILLDGRSIYDAFKGGAELEFYPIFLENIERIEIGRASCRERV